MSTPHRFFVLPTPLRVLTLFLFLASWPSPIALMTTDLSMINLRIKEGIQSGSAVGNLADFPPVRQVLSDGAKNAEYQVFPNNDPGAALFEIGKKSGVVKTTGPVDREKICGQSDADCTVMLHVQLLPSSQKEGKDDGEATLKPQPVMEALTPKLLQVIITIEDINDNAPTFGSRSKELQTPENSAIGTLIDLPTAQDADTPANGVVKYSLNATDGVFDLVIRKSVQDGVTVLMPLLKQMKKLDRETTPAYAYALTARDKDGRQGQILIRLSLVDVNDNAPRWEKAPYKIEMPECKPLGEALIRVRATDADEGSNGRVRYSIAASANLRIQQMFYMNGEELFANENPDYEKDHKVVVPLVAQDGGRLQSSTKVEITVVDCNDHRPSISVRGRHGANPRILENSRSARVVATLVVSDGDSGENGRTACSIDATSHFELREVNSPFQMGGSSRKGRSRTQYYELLTLAGAEFDRERHPRHHVTVTCRDFGTHPLSSKRTLVVEVTDENDNAPNFARAIIRLRINENNRPGDLVGSVRATDPDFGNNGLITYSLESADPPAKDDEGSGKKKDADKEDKKEDKKEMAFRIDMQGNLRALTRFDREKRERYRLRVIATDGGRKRRLSASALVIVNIADVNDNPPRFAKNTFEFEVLESNGLQRLQSILLGRLNASDPDNGGNGSLRFSIADFLPPLRCRHCFTIDSDGNLRVSGHIDREEAASYRFRVVAYDQGSPVQLSGSTWVQVTVKDRNDNKPKLLFPAPAVNDTVKIEADTPAGHQIAQLRAIDKDEGKNGRIIFKLAPAHPLFLLESDGRLILKKEIDRSSSRRTFKYQLVVRAGNPPDADNAQRRGSEMVTVGLLNVLVIRRHRPRPWDPHQTGHNSGGLGLGGRGRIGSGSGMDASMGDRDGGMGGRRSSMRSNSLLLLILTAASVVVFVLVVAIFALVYLRKIPCQGSAAVKRRRGPDDEEKGPGGRPEELFPIQGRGDVVDNEKASVADSDQSKATAEKTLRKAHTRYTTTEKCAPSLLDRQASSGANYAYIPAPTFESLERARGCGSDATETEMPGTGKLSRKCYRPAGAECHAYTELEVRDILLPEFANSKDSHHPDPHQQAVPTYQNTLKNSSWALSGGTAQRTPVITSSFV